MIGFFGGSFDPVHYGHLKNASIVKKELDLESLFLMPCSHPAQKSDLLFSSKERLDMLKIATEEFADLSIDTREIDANSISYTINSIVDIKKEYPNTAVCLVVGMDCFVNLSTWKNYEKFHKYVHLIVIDRPNYRPENEKSYCFNRCYDISQLNDTASGLLYFTSSEMLDISSSDIRYKLHANMDLTSLIPSSVINYMRNRNET